MSIIFMPMMFPRSLMHLHLTFSGLVCLLALWEQQESCPFTTRLRVLKLRQAREPGEIGLALLQEGILALLTLFGHVVEHGGVASQFLNTGQAVGVRIESRFEEAQGKRAFLQHLAGPLYGLFFQAFQGHDGVDQSHVEGLLGCVLAAEIPDLTGFFMSDDACHVGSTPTGVKAANLRTGLPEPGIVSGNRQVAELNYPVTT